LEAVTVGAAFVPTVDWPQEAEHAVLGSMLLDPEAFERVSVEAGMHGTDFADPRHSTIFTAAAKLYSRGVAIDVVSMTDSLRASGQLDRVGGVRFLNELCAATPNPARAVNYARQVLAGRRERRRLELRDRIKRLAAESADDAQLGVQLSAALEELAEFSAGPADAPGVIFARVPVADLYAAQPQPQQWWWDCYVPAGHVTLWSGHGGAGKSTLALMLLVCIALGLPFLGKGTRRGRVLFFSAEDPGQLVRLRLRKICALLDVDPVALGEWLIVLDATELDAALYVEQRTAGVRHGCTTPVYEALREYVEAEAVDVLVLDNASDLFEGDEIVRTLVRGFIRSLAQLVRPRQGAVVLLAHVDKSTSRAGKGASTESYSGSTAWNNTVRSRLVLIEREPGQLELQHQKCNLGPKQAAVRLAWPEGGLPTMEGPDLPDLDAPQRPSADAAMRALVGLIRDYYSRGEWVSTSMQSQTSAARLFEHEPRYPRHLRPSQVAQLLREAQRARFIEPETFKGMDRKPRERWRVTSAGAAMVDNLPLFVAGGAREQ
jgi:hypothetical protein